MARVYHAAPLIAAQLLCAYGFDSLLAWTLAFLAKEILRWTRDVTSSPASASA